MCNVYACTCTYSSLASIRCSTHTMHLLQCLKVRSHPLTVLECTQGGCQNVLISPLKLLHTCMHAGGHCLGKLLAGKRSECAVWWGQDVGSW